MTIKTNILAFILMLTVLLPLHAKADLVGRAEVGDGDTFRVQGEKIRLHGIDAPEGEQTCRDGDDRVYQCGSRAALFLDDLIGQRTIHCEGRYRDRYGRLVVDCRVGEVDLNRQMVRSGWALNEPRYTREYVDDERAAKAAKAGMWQGRFVPPWEWRRGVRLDPLHPEGCPIKGNISGNGRIYHMPGTLSYGRTRIDTSRGERWFCSREEAEKAGWRAAR